MKQQNFEIIFNNGKLRQILMLPETPLNIILLFPEKELILREKNNANGLYVISHQRGFPEADANYEIDQEIPTTSQNHETNHLETNQNHLDLENSKYFFKRSEESSKLSTRQASSANTIQSFANSVNINNSKVISNGSYNTSHTSPVITEENGSILHPLEKFSKVRNLKQNVTLVKGPVISRNTTFTQSKELKRNIIAKKNKSVTAQSSLTTLNGQVEIAMLIRQNEPAIKSNTNHSKSNESGKISVGDTENVHDFETSVIKNTSDDDDMIMDLASYSSDNSNDAENNINALSKKCISSTVIKNKFNRICNKESKQGQGMVESVHHTRYPQKKRCAICLKNKRPGQTFSNFPISCKISDIWAKASGRKWVLNATPHERRTRYRVCSDHFKKEYYRGKRLYRDAIPTQNLPKSSKTSISVQLNTDFLTRIKSKLQLALQKSDAPKNSSPQRTVSLGLNGTHFQKMAVQQPTKQPQKTTTRLFNKSITDIHCCVAHCTSTRLKSPECSFHNFPPENVFYIVNMYGISVSVNLRDEWIRLLQIMNPVTNHMQVCSSHFQKSDFIPPSNIFQSPRLKKNTIPSQNLPDKDSNSGPEKELAPEMMRNDMQA